MLKNALFAAAAAIATLATAAPTLAKDVVVPYGDLDLSNPKDQTVFARRIHRAAKRACDIRSDLHPYTKEERECYLAAHVKAKAQMASLVQDQRLGG